MIKKMIRRMISGFRDWRTNRLINSDLTQSCNGYNEQMGYKLNRAKCTPKKVVWEGPNGRISLQ